MYPINLDEYLPALPYAYKIDPVNEDAQFVQPVQAAQAAIAAANNVPQQMPPNLKNKLLFGYLQKLASLQILEIPAVVFKQLGDLTIDQFIQFILWHQLLAQVRPSKKITPEYLTIKNYTFYREMAYLIFSGQRENQQLEVLERDIIEIACITSNTPPNESEKKISEVTELFKIIKQICKLNKDSTLKSINPEFFDNVPSTIPFNFLWDQFLKNHHRQKKVKDWLYEQLTKYTNNASKKLQKAPIPCFRIKTKNTSQKSLLSTPFAVFDSSLARKKHFINLSKKFNRNIISRTKSFLSLLKLMNNLERNLETCQNLKDKILLLREIEKIRNRQRKLYRSISHHCTFFTLIMAEKFGLISNELSSNRYLSHRVVVMSTLLKCRDFFFGRLDHFLQSHKNSSEKIGLTDFYLRMERMLHPSLEVSKSEKARNNSIFEQFFKALEDFLFECEKEIFEKSPQSNLFGTLANAYFNKKSYSHEYFFTVINDEIKNAHKQNITVDLSELINIIKQGMNTGQEHCRNVFNNLLQYKHQYIGFMLEKISKGNDKELEQLGGEQEEFIIMTLLLVTELSELSSINRVVDICYPKDLDRVIEQEQQLSYNFILTNAEYDSKQPEHRKEKASIALLDEQGNEVVQNEDVSVVAAAAAAAAAPAQQAQIPIQHYLPGNFKAQVEKNSSFVFAIHLSRQQVLEQEKKFYLHHIQRAYELLKFQPNNKSLLTMLVQYLYLLQERPLGELLLKKQPQQKLKHGLVWRLKELQLDDVINHGLKVNYGNFWGRYPHQELDYYKGNTPGLLALISQNKGEFSEDYLLSSFIVQARANGKSEVDSVEAGKEALRMLKVETKEIQPKSSISFKALIKRLDETIKMTSGIKQQDGTLKDLQHHLYLLRELLSAASHYSYQRYLSLFEDGSLFHITHSIDLIMVALGEKYQEISLQGFHDLMVNSDTLELDLTSNERELLQRINVLKLRESPHMAFHQYKKLPKALNDLDAAYTLSLLEEGFGIQGKESYSYDKFVNNRMNELSLIQRLLEEFEEEEENNLQSEEERKDAV